MITLLLATRNQHKTGEIRSVLSNQIRYLTLLETPGAPPIPEDTGTFAGNATKKACGLAEWLRCHSPLAVAPDRVFVLADDSGLEVDALGGEPGVHSARFAALDSERKGANSSDAANNTKLLRLLTGLPMEQRTARFRCVLALTPVPEPAHENKSPVCYGAEPEFQTELFEGTCEGRIAFAPNGAGGFGYDPLFIPTGYSQSFAELGESVKNQISHRARALAQLRRRLVPG